MRNLLAFLAAAVLTFAGVGWYLNWYTITSEVKPSGNRNVNIDFNSVKIVDDVHKGVQKGEEKLQGLRDKTPATEPAKAVDIKPATAAQQIPLRIVP